MRDEYLIFREGQRAIADPRNFQLYSSSPEEKKIFTTFITHTLQFPFDAKQNSAEVIPRFLSPALFCFDYHFERLRTSAKMLDILGHASKEDESSNLKSETLRSIQQFFEEDQARGEKYALAAARIAQQGEGDKDTIPSIRIRLLFTKSSFEIYLDPFVEVWHDPIDVITFAGERPLPEHKTCFITVNMAARDEAKRRGAEEALLVNRKNVITEGAWTNVFWFDRNGKLYTPPRNLLPGITRRVILEMVNCTFDEISGEQLKRVASEVFVTQSTTGITPVKTINGKRLGWGTHAETFALKKKFELEIQKRAVPLLERCSHRCLPVVLSETEEE